MHGATFTSDPTGTLSISVKASDGGPGSVSRYRCGTGTAEFLSCGICGVVGAATWRRDDGGGGAADDGDDNGGGGAGGNGDGKGKLLSVVRVQCLKGDVREELLGYERKWSVEHELAEPEERLRRRERTWTPTEVVERV